MDIPGVSFYLENKKMFPFPLLSGIHQSKMPEPSEFQGVSLTGQEIDTECFFAVELEKQSFNVFPETKPNFIFGRSEHTTPRRGICGHFNSFSDISISQLVGGFVGSKSQIRPVNRETCQVWDVIFQQLAETADRPSKVQGNTHSYCNIRKAFSQNLFNSFYQGGKSALDGITSFLISKNCEGSSGKELVQAKSESLVKEMAPPPMVHRDVISRSGDSNSLLPSNTSLRNSELNTAKFAPVNTSRQSYAQVTKTSAVCKPVSPRTGRPTKPLPLPLFNKNSQKQMKKMSKAKCYVNSREMSTRHAFERNNWRERNDSAQGVHRKTQISGYQNKQSKKINEVYPAFNCKNHSKSPEGKKLERFSKHYPNDFKHTNREVKSSHNGESEVRAQVPAFGGKFKIVSKDFLSRTKEIRKGKKYVEKRNMHFFNLQANNGNFCRNWRCKHTGVVCGDTEDHEKMCSGTNLVFSKTDELSTEAGISEVPVVNNNSDLSVNCLLEEPSSTGHISVSGSFVDLSDVSNGRNRFLSECSVDSDDSFMVMFESDAMSGENCDVRIMHRYPSCDSFASDSWSDDDSDDDCFQGNNDQTSLDEVDFCFFSPPLIVSSEGCGYSDKLRIINKNWREQSASWPSVEKSPEKVHFADKLTTVHVMVTWDFAYRAARCGPWEEMARDRARFQTRIDRSETVLAPVLTPEHRCRVQQRMESSAIR